MRGKSRCSIGNTSTHSWWILQPVMLVFGGTVGIPYKCSLNKETYSLKTKKNGNSLDDYWQKPRINKSIRPYGLTMVTVVLMINLPKLSRIRSPHFASHVFPSSGKSIWDCKGLQNPPEPRKKKCFPLYWLVNRDPYNGLFHTWVV